MRSRFCSLYVRLIISQIPSERRCPDDERRYRSRGFRRSPCGLKVEVLYGSISIVQIALNTFDGDVVVDVSIGRPFDCCFGEGTHCIICCQIKRHERFVECEYSHIVITAVIRYRVYGISSGRSIAGICAFRSKQIICFRFCTVAIGISNLQIYFEEFKVLVSLLASM